MAIEIAQEQYGAVRILVLSGRLDTETSADLELAVQDLLEANDRHFVIDLGAISYVSSAGLRVLLSLAKQLDGGRGSLRLCGLNASVTQVFDVAGFSKLFVIFPNRASALAGHPQARLDPLFAKKVASLIGAPESTSAPDRNTSELARSAGRLLDEGKPVTPPVKERSTPAPVARVSTQSSDPPSVLGKLRRWFGGRR